MDFAFSGASWSVPAPEKTRPLRGFAAATERRIASQGGERVWVETGGKPLYAPTRAFYAACGYAVAGELRDYYARGDAKVVYVKHL